MPVTKRFIATVSIPEDTWEEDRFTTQVSLFDEELEDFFEPEQEIRNAEGLQNHCRNIATLIAKVNSEDALSRDERDRITDFYIEVCSHLL